MSKFDKDLKIGDMIVAYHRGIFRVVEIKRRFITKYDTKDVMQWGKELNAIISYKMIADSNGIPKKGVAVRECDVSYCSPAIPALNAKIQEYMETVKRLTSLAVVASIT